MPEPVIASNDFVDCLDPIPIINWHKILSQIPTNSKSILKISIESHTFRNGISILKSEFSFYRQLYVERKF